MEPLNVRAERHRASILGWSLTLAMLVTLAADFVLLRLALLVNPAVALSAEGSAWISAAAQFGVGYPACLLMMARIPADPMEKFSLRPGQIADAFLVCCFVLMAGDLLGLTVNFGLSELLGHTTENTIEEVLTSSSLLYNLVTSVIAAPVFEELICRKGMIDRLNRLGDRPAMVVSALFFALIHGNFYQFFYAFGVGLIFGYLYLRTGKLRYTIGLHMAVNLVFGVLPGVLADGGRMTALLLWELLLLAAAAVGLVRAIGWWRRRRLLRGWIRLPGNRYAFLIFENVGVAVCLILCVVQFLLSIL